jgi:hypothetical protein
VEGETQHEMMSPAEARTLEILTLRMMTFALKGRVSLDATIRKFLLPD